MRALSLVLLVTGTVAFSPCSPKDGHVKIGCPPTVSRKNAVTLASTTNNKDNGAMDRANFLTTAATQVVFSVAAVNSLVPTASARGRATLDTSYDRYTPRILAGGSFYGSDFKRMVGSSDWEAIKKATSDPPKKTKADRSKPDGGIADRAALAGQFSDARVLVACDLFAAAFSDNSISTKTKKMQTEVEKLRTIVADMNAAARQAMGEDSGGGGLFGLGGKKKSQSELANTVKQLYVEGGNAWNQYIFAANEELPLSLEKLQYLK